MEFKKGSNILTSEGETAGTLKRVVLDPRSKKVAFLVIERGLLFTEDKLVPMDFVEKVNEAGVILHESKKAIEKLNKFEETHYVPLGGSGEDPDAYYWYPPLSGVTMGAYPLFPQPVYIEKTESNIPENYIALKEGARIITADGKHIGNIERIITDMKSDRVTHLVISSGLLLKEEKVVPAHWIRDVSEDEVHLSIDAAFADKLVHFEPDH